MTSKKDDAETLRKVLEGIRRGAGRAGGREATADEIAEAERLMARDRKAAQKRDYGRRTDDVIDTGLFD